MRQLPGTEVWHGQAPREGWAAAVRQHRAGRLEGVHGDVRDIGWIAGGIADEGGTVRDGWREALTCASSAVAGATVLARRGNVAFTTNLAVSREGALTAMSRSALDQDCIIRRMEPLIEVVVGPRAALWSLVRRVLPPDEDLRSAGDPPMARRVRTPPGQPGRSAVVAAVGHAGAAAVRTMAWVTAAKGLWRIDDAGAWQVGPGDLRRQLLSSLAGHG